MDPLRNSGKAVIIRDEFLQVVVRQDAEGEWFSLPGGGQEAGEMLTDALQRECPEELAVSVKVGPLRPIREYMGANRESSREDADVHPADFMFECALAGAPPHFTAS
jgi:8-oxo-dGTP diphosphatase